MHMLLALEPHTIFFFCVSVTLRRCVQGRLWQSRTLCRAASPSWHTWYLKQPPQMRKKMTRAGAANRTASSVSSNEVGGGGPTLDWCGCREAREGEYEWVREYQYDVSNKQDAGGGTSTYLLHLEDGRATYVDLNTRMRCTKRTRGSQGADLRTEFPRPSKVGSPGQPSCESEDGRYARL